MSNYPITNFIIFDEVLRRAPHLIKRIVELFTDIRIDEELVVDKERNTAVHPDHKWTIFDAHGYSRKNSVIMEMLGYFCPDYPLRSRHYISTHDVYWLRPGNPYSSLPDTLLFTISTEDQYRLGKTIIIEELMDIDTHIDMKHRIRIVTLFVKGPQENLNLQQKAFLNYIKDGIVSDELTAEIHRLVTEVNQEPLIKEKAMDYKTRIDIEIEERSRVRAEELAQVRAEELAIEKVESDTADYVKAISNGLKISYVSAMDLLKIKKEVRPKVMSLLNAD